MTSVAITFLLEDLQNNDGGPMHLGSIAVGAIGMAPGPTHSIEPRHWHWALIEHPDLAIMLRGGGV